MKPIDFILDCADHHNDPVGAVIEALQKPMRILGYHGEYVVLSYYFDEEDKCMILDIQDKSEIDDEE